MLKLGKKLQSILVCMTLTAACGRGAPPETPETNGTDASQAALCAAGPGEVFDQRVRPLLAADRESSCGKCHAAGVTLAAFVAGDPCSSMACLVEQGLVDLEAPEDSRLLGLIARGFDPGAENTPTDEMASQEYEGFREWIEWSASCPSSCEPQDGSLECGVPETPLLEPETPPEVPPDLTLENYPCTVEDQTRAFRDWVYPPEGRCGHCHAVDGAIAGIADAPTWIAANNTMEGSARTIQALFALEAIDLDKPTASLLLRKPLDVEEGGVEHGGGGKFHDTEDPLYISMLQWIRMQASCRITADLPVPDWPEDKLRDTYEKNVPYPH